MRRPSRDRCAANFAIPAAAPATIQCARRAPAPLPVAIAAAALRTLRRKRTRTRRPAVGGRLSRATALE
ncbi:hypothetical protein GLE_5285 [Lysobacter enzymogenes]|uniref:Uncharacterized protein n=1 Tax=Lysobacter enzymogenes TaxID=69 RepID=A0A0S2DPU4_LYSEN|nr:hypothetical protein GLE_5285 [Lysobacter enzymogenes]